MIFKNNCIQVISYTTNFLNFYNCLLSTFHRIFFFFVSCLAIKEILYPFHLNASMGSFIFVNLETWALIEIEKKIYPKIPWGGEVIGKGGITKISICQLTYVLNEFIILFMCG